MKDEVNISLEYDRLKQVWWTGKWERGPENFFSFSKVCEAVRRFGARQINVYSIHPAKIWNANGKRTEGKSWFSRKLVWTDSKSWMIIWKSCAISKSNCENEIFQSFDTRVRRTINFVKRAIRREELVSLDFALEIEYQMDEKRRIKFHPW